MPQLQIPEKLYPLFHKQKRFKGAFGGRGGAKSQSFADMLLHKAQVNHFKIGCFREYQNSIDDSVYSLLNAEIARMNLRGFKTRGNNITHKRGGAFKFKGLARNPESVKSMYGFKIFWLEEAQTTSQDSLKLLTPTLREDDSEIWMSLNPMSAADPISQRFLEPFMDQLLETGVYEDDLHYITWINYYDNPWFPDSLNQERLYDKSTMSKALYNHVWLGHYNDTVEEAIIDPDWFEAAIDSHIKLGFKPRGVKVCAFDPADIGNDDKAYVIRHGSVILDMGTKSTGDANDGCDWATSKAIEHQVDLFVWDGDGLGAALNRQVKNTFKGKHIDYVMFKGSNKPDDPNSVYEGESFTKNLSRTDPKRQRTNREVFKNKRAQYYWRAADRFYNTWRAVVKKEYVDPDYIISIPSRHPKLNQLRTEICRVPRKYNSNGLLQAMSKEEMRRKKIKSPNLADDVIMSLVVPKLLKAVDDLEFESLW